MKQTLIYPLILCLLFLKESNGGPALIKKQSFDVLFTRSFQVKDPLAFTHTTGIDILTEYTLFDENEEDESEDSSPKKKLIVSYISPILPDRHSRICFSGSIANLPLFYRRCDPVFYDRYIFQHVLRV